MRIGILTLPLHVNIGGLLQAYALQTILQRHHDTVVVFDSTKHLHPCFFLKLMKIGVRVLRKYVMNNKNVSIFAEREYMVISRNTRRFADNYIQRYEVSDYSKLDRNYFDALVVGSDQIWRKSFVQRVEDVFFDFARDWNVKRISYAASFGSEEWKYSEEETTACRQLAMKFNLVTVREDSAVNLCSKHLGINAKHVLDPTMLLEKEDYLKLVYKSEAKKSAGNMLVYLLDSSSERMTFAREVGQTKGFTPFYVFSRVADNTLSLQDRIQPSVEQWLRGFMDAKMVVTDSFHACAFSIIFNVPFVVISHIGGGLTRIYSLLKMFELEHCLVKNLEQITCMPDIDWDKVNNLRASKKEECITLLYNSLV